MSPGEITIFDVHITTQTMNITGFLKMQRMSTQSTLAVILILYLFVSFLQMKKQCSNIYLEQTKFLWFTPSF